MNTFAGAVTSACVRYLMSHDKSYIFTIPTGRQSLLFNTLDMIISSCASHVFAKQLQNQDPIKGLLLGRALGFVLAATITTLATGPLDLVVILTMSAVSQIAGFCVNAALQKESHFNFLIV